MIRAYGPGKWVRAFVKPGPGSEEEGAASLKSGGALERYAAHMERESVLRATCEDYREEDVPAQESDRKEGKRIAVPLLIMFSAAGMGSRFDMKAVWEEWVEEGVSMDVKPIGGGAGHFFAEERPEEAVAGLLGWIEKL